MQKHMRSQRIADALETAAILSKQVQAAIESPMTTNCADEKAARNCLELASLQIASAHSLLCSAAQNDSRARAFARSAPGDKK